MSGELDISNAADAVNALTAAAAVCLRIIVDLAGLTFIDCAGLSALASVRKQSRQTGGDLLLAALPQRILRLLCLTGLIAVLPVAASVADAIDGARRSSQLAAHMAGPLGSEALLTGAR